MSKKAKYLVIMESPSKCRKVSEYLGDEYIVKASMGHITDLAKGGKFGIGVDVENDFKPRYVLNEDKYSLMEELMEDAKNVKKIYIFTDPDREGENIAWHLYERLVDVGKPIVRGRFNEIKKDKVLKAIEEAGELNMPLVRAAESRRILDRIVGFNSSPYLMNTVGKGLSAGRVQSVLVRLVIDKERSIEEFVPETFWTLQTSGKKDNINFPIKLPYSIKDEQEGKDLFKKLKETKQFEVVQVHADNEKKFPIPPLITSTLQRVMSSEFGMSAEDTMKAAQALYEQGNITYIRTDSVRASEEAIESVREYIKENKFELPQKAYAYKNKDNSQDAHECLRPSNLQLDPNENYDIINLNEKKVYKAIHNYFVASQMEPAIYSTLKITFRSKEHPDLEMKASGKALISLGFLEIFNKKVDEAMEIPSFKKGDILDLNINCAKLEKKATQPPARFSEAKLIKELEQRGIGRPATYAQLLSKITDRNYVEKNGVVYRATDLGKKITDLLSKNFSFMDYDYTKKMEEELDEIAKGKKTSLEMLQAFYPPFKEELNNAYKKAGSTFCEKCNSVMNKRKGKNGDFIACSNYPSCFNTKSLDSN